MASTSKSILMFGTIQIYEFYEGITKANKIFMPEICNTTI